MTNLINKLRSALSNMVLFTASIVMAGLGFAFVGALALFAFAAIGIAMLAAPFVSQPQHADAKADITA